MLAESQTKGYLAKLGLAGPPAKDRDGLDELVRRHQMNIPFSTVDMCRSGNAPDLGLETIYEKVVERGRGGYCFELNKLFESLLLSLGFKAVPALSRAVRGRDSRMPINHRGTVVHLDDDTYFADVGFGGPMPAGSLLLRDGLQQEVQGETYMTQQGDNGWWRINRLTQAASDLFDDNAPKRVQTELELCTASVEDMDFNALNLFCSQPGTLFHDSEVANIRTAGGNKAYKDGVLTIRDNGRKQILEFASEEERNAALEEHFGIVRDM